MVGRAVRRWGVLGKVEVVLLRGKAPRVQVQCAAGTRLINVLTMPC